MMATCPSFRFDPVNCVITILGDDGEAFRIFELLGADSVIVIDGEERYRGIVGSMVYLGNQRTRPSATAAVIFELPDGRRRATGAATLRFDGSDAEARIEAFTDLGEHVVFKLKARCVDADAPAQSVSATS